MTAIHWTVAAEADADEIWFWVAADSPRAAHRLLDEFDDAAKLLAKFPEAGIARENLAPGLRSLPVESYLLFYRSVDDGLEIVRVLHGRRDIGPDLF
jgi:toxin ParE1/3/4